MFTVEPCDNLLALDIIRHFNPGKSLNECKMAALDLVDWAVKECSEPGDRLKIASEKALVKRDDA
jgi:hypothetical protein